MLVILIGCGLRRGELLALRVNSTQLREEHWVIADLVGKAGHIRTVPIPAWVKFAIDEWKEASGITEGVLFRSINKTGRIWGTGMTPKVVWEIVRSAASRAGIDNLHPMTFGAMPNPGLCRMRTRSPHWDGVPPRAMRHSPCLPLLSQSIIAGLGQGALVCRNKPSDSFARGQLPVV